MAAKKKRKYNKGGNITSTMLYRAMMKKKYEESSNVDWKPEGKGFTSNYRVIPNLEGGTDSIPYTPPNVYFNNKNQHDTQIGNDDVEFGKGTGFDRTIQTMHGPLSLSANREYLPLQEATLKALAHKYRGKKLTEPYIIEGRGGKEDTRGVLTEREQAQLKKYMEETPTLQKAYEFLPNVFGEYGGSALPIKSRLFQERGTGAEGSEQSIHSGRYNTSGNININKYQDSSNVDDYVTGYYPELAGKTGNPYDEATYNTGETIVGYQGQKTNYGLVDNTVPKTDIIGNVNPVGPQGQTMSAEAMSRMDLSQQNAIANTGLSQVNPDTGVIEPIPAEGGAPGGTVPWGAIGTAVAKGGSALEEQSGGTGQGRGTQKGRGRRNVGQVSGGLGQSIGKGAATGATIGGIAGTIFPGAGNIVGAAGGALIGAIVGLGTGIGKQLSSGRKAKKEYAAQARMGALQTQEERHEATSNLEQQILQQREQGEKIQQDTTSYNPYETLMPDAMPQKTDDYYKKWKFGKWHPRNKPEGEGDEQKYASSGKITALLNYKNTVEKSNNDLRINLNSNKTQVQNSLTGNLGLSQPERGFMGGYSGNFNAALGNNMGITGGGQVAPVKMGPNYGVRRQGGVSAYYNPTENTQLRLGYGGQGAPWGGGSNVTAGASFNFPQKQMQVPKYESSSNVMSELDKQEINYTAARDAEINRTQTSYDQQLLNNQRNIPVSGVQQGMEEGIVTGYNQGGPVSFKGGHYYNQGGECMTCPKGYDSSGSVDSHVSQILSNISRDYMPPGSMQNKNTFATQIGPDQTITEPGTYQVNGPTHEEGGTKETVPTRATDENPKGMQTAEFDNEEFLKTEKVVGGMTTFSFNNHGENKDADAFQVIGASLEKTKKELELLAEMNPEYLAEIKKVLG